MRIIAEGVEKREQADYLRQQGVDYAQGWYYSKSMPIEPFIAFVRAYNGPPLKGESVAE